MINQNTMDLLDAYGFGADIDAFESYVMQVQDAAGQGAPMVTDAQYDDYIHLLKELKPESVALNRNWEKDDVELDDNDAYLKSYGMKSIRTIQDLSELEYFKQFMTDEEIEFCISSKINGYGVRAVYRNGVLVSGSTRGRYKKGRDITRHLRAVLPDNIPELSDVDMAEIRGELYVSYDNFEKIRNVVKTPLSAVTSLSRESATDDDIKMLSFRAYQILTDELEFDTLYSKFEFLQKCGFKCPYCIKATGINAGNFDDFIESVIEHFTQIVEAGKMEYDNDGIVVAINDINKFNGLGTEGNTMLGNFALKVGHWESNIYSSVIESIEWCYGKRYITPKAIIHGVITRNGAEVKNVPLYNVGVMEENGYYPGNQVYFKFGGETGVTTVRPDGSPV